MAESKYDLFLMPNKPDKVIQQQPWYKERLRTKYIKQRKKRETSESLIGRNWVLIRSGIDDFRDGKPPNFGGQYIVEGSKGISPIISNCKDSISSRLRRNKIKPRHPKPSLTESQIYFDKRLPLQRKRYNHIEEVEYGLTQHPLALYSHLEEGMSPELFEDIVDLLDPAMNPDAESELDGSSSYTDRHTTGDGSMIRTNIAEEDEDEQGDESEETEKNVHCNESTSRNPYKWILNKDSAQKDEKRRMKKRPTSPSEDEHIKEVTKEFCDWVSGLGGETNNVEESTIMSLFASGYETKPALSVPIHVVELSNVPTELRISAGISPHGSAKLSPSSIPGQQSHADDNELGYEPSWVKVKYGAWYLDPETWKVRGENEPLEDPDEEAKKEQSESKKKSNEMDSQLATLHGARAFRDFLGRNHKRVPDFMEKVSDLQDIEDAKNDLMQMSKAEQFSSHTIDRERSSVASKSMMSSGVRR